MREWSATFRDSRRVASIKALVLVSLLLGVGTIAVATAVLEQQGNKTGGLSEGEGSQLVVSGALSVPSGSGNATLMVYVKNAANRPVVSITFPGNGSSFSNLGDLQLQSGGKPVSGTNPLQVGVTACGTLQVQNVTAGDVYTVVVDSGFNDSSSQVWTVSMTAQLGEVGCSSVGGQTTSQTTTSCDAATPLSTEQVGPVAYSNFGNSSSYPSLIVVWWNCSDEVLHFSMAASPLTVSVRWANGTVSDVGATLDVLFQNSTRVVGGDAGVGLELPIIFSQPLEPGATILHVNGTITAVDPVTNRQLSAEITIMT
jgi:hypothetical protein